MAMWRDPLDELIADLEQAVPAATASLFDDIPTMTDYCYFGASILSRDPAERRRLADDPCVKRVQAYHDRLARARHSPDPATLQK
jgi:hypothetical protein